MPPYLGNGLTLIELLHTLNIKRANNTLEWLCCPTVAALFLSIGFCLLMGGSTANTRPEREIRSPASSSC